MYMNNCDDCERRNEDEWIRIDEALDFVIDNGLLKPSDISSYLEGTVYPYSTNKDDIDKLQGLLKLKEYIDKIDWTMVQNIVIASKL